MTNYEKLFYHLRNEVDKTVLFKYVNIFGNDIFHNPNYYMCVGTTTPVVFKDSLIAKQIGDYNLHYEFRIADNKLYTMVHFENKYDVNSYLHQEIKNYCEKVAKLKRYEDKETAFFYYINDTSEDSKRDDSRIDLKCFREETDQTKLNNQIKQVVNEAIKELKKLDKRFRGI